jgi:hypothetical protein
MDEAIIGALSKLVTETAADRGVVATLTDANARLAKQLEDNSNELREKHQQPQQEVANNVYELGNTGALVNYLHKSMFSPTKSALLQTVKNGHLITWPGLTEQAINTNLKLTPATTMGHMNQRRQNIRSPSKTPITSDIEAVTVTPAGLGTKTHLVYAVLVNQGQLYTDLTGKFPVRSSKGNWYVMVCYVFD